MAKKLACVLIGMMFICDVPFTHAQQQDDNYQLVFSDEFNQPNGSQPDSTKWSRHSRYAGTWSRWISNSPKVVYIKNGCLVCRAIPNKSELTDSASMLTGAINSLGKFSFQYGRVEVRMKTNLKRGNFPAVWMRPANNNDSRYGEIDIVEMFGNQRKVHHTVHTHRSYTLEKKDIKNTFEENIDIRKWHIYGVEWTKDVIRWTLDGKVTGEYFRINSPEMNQEGQWTFDRPFFLILNQSVGNGSAPHFIPNTKQIYETQFDWIRVYQKKK